MTHSSQTCAPLRGIQVLDLTRAVTGPFCTMLLGDLGARVIKIEEPGTGDETRLWGPPFTEGESTYFMSVNRNKESVAVDLKSDAGRAAVQQIAGQSDVVVQNFRPGVAERLGLGYDTLHAGNPGLIYISITGFGLTGPDSQRPGYDLIIQAMSGLMLASGSEGSPAKTCFPVADVIAGQFACQAVLAALFERQTTGRGASVEVSLLESLLSAMSGLTAATLFTGKAPSAVGIGNASIVPYQLLRCSDQAIAVGVPNERLWRRFCEALGRPLWLSDARYATNATRVQHREALIAEIESVMGTRTASEWTIILDQHEVPCGPMLALDEILNHPQVLARGSVVEVEHPTAGPIRLVANPMRFRGREIEYRPPPTLGQHTESVFERLSQTEEPEFSHGGLNEYATP